MPEFVRREPGSAMVRAAASIVTLLGAAQGLRSTAGSISYGFYAADHHLRKRVAEDARRALGDDAYRRALEAGRV